MIRGFAAVCAASLLLLTPSCNRAPAGVPLLRLEPGAAPAGEAATLRGRLVRSGACLAVEGNGNVVVTWPRSAQARADGNGNVIVVWPFGRSKPPIRTGETVELTGIIITEDNLSGIARIPDDPGCRGQRYLAVREGPAPAGAVELPRLQPGANPRGETARLRGTLVRSGACLAVPGNGTTVVIWPRSAPRSGGHGNTVVIWPRQAEARADGNGNTIIVWPFGRSNPPVRTGETVDLAGILVLEDDITAFAQLSRDPGCRGDHYLAVREAHPAD